jgi:hypothetical protein
VAYPQYTIHAGASFQSFTINLQHNGTYELKSAIQFNIGAEYESKKGRITGVRMRYVPRNYPLDYSYTAPGGGCSMDVDVNHHLLFFSMRRHILNSFKHSSFRLFAEPFITYNLQASQGGIYSCWNMVSGIQDPFYHTAELQSYSQLGLLLNAQYLFNSSDEHCWYIEASAGASIFNIRNDGQKTVMELANSTSNYNGFIIEVGVGLQFLLGSKTREI